jgi:hypothetical protein
VSKRQKKKFSNERSRRKDFVIRFEWGSPYVAKWRHVLPENDRHVDDVRYGSKVEAGIVD